MSRSYRERLVEFHKAGGQPVLETPQVPSDERVRLRLRLLAEEFLELLEAAYEDVHVRGALSDFIETASLKVDLPEFVDALTDMTVIIEGTHLEFGSDSEQSFDEVHDANMRKFPRCVYCNSSGYVNAFHSAMVEKCLPCGGNGRVALRRPDGKIIKPEGWVGPDIEGVLKRQGWRP